MSPASAFGLMTRQDVTTCVSKFYVMFMVLCLVYLSYIVRMLCSLGRMVCTSYRMCTVYCLYLTAVNLYWAV